MVALGVAVRVVAVSKEKVRLPLSVGLLGGGGRWTGVMGLFFSAVFHAEAVALDDDRLAMMEEAVEDGAGDGFVAEDGVPLMKGAVAGNDDAAAFVPGAEDLEEEIGALLADGEVADFVEAEEVGSGVGVHGTEEGAGLVGGVKAVDDVDGGLEADAVAVSAGVLGEGNGQMGLALMESFP